MAKTQRPLACVVNFCDRLLLEAQTLVRGEKEDWVRSKSDFHNSGAFAGRLSVLCEGDQRECFYQLGCSDQGFYGFRCRILLLLCFLIPFPYKAPARRHQNCTSNKCKTKSVTWTKPSRRSFRDLGCMTMILAVHLFKCSSFIAFGLCVMMLWGAVFHFHSKTEKEKAKEKTEMHVSFFSLLHLKFRDINALCGNLCGQ